MFFTVSIQSFKKNLFVTGNIIKCQRKYTDQQFASLKSEIFLRENTEQY